MFADHVDTFGFFFVFVLFFSPSFTLPSETDGISEVHAKHFQHV